jgi:hypothetical protein
VPDGIISQPNVILGGTGFFNDGGKNLYKAIEHHMPDYLLYDDYVKKELLKGRSRSTVSDYLDYSIGFTTRGCFRKCSFCVNKKYDKAVLHSPVSEFFDPSRPYIYLWDDNFLSHPKWASILDDLDETGRPFQFRQGLDMRLMTEEKAKRLSEVRYHGDFIFAFDHLEDRDLIEEKLKLWKRYNTKIAKLYVLCAYDSNDAYDIKNTFERIKILMKYGCLPYIMRYEKYKDSPWRTLYIQIARWCNQPQFFKKKSFRQFCIANQDYHKNKNTTCSAYKAMLDFEIAYPDIAKKYFDLRYDEENLYGNAYGYGRRYANKKPCITCVDQQITWENAYKGDMSLSKVMSMYFTKDMDFQCFSYADIACTQYSAKEISTWFCDILLTTPLDNVFTAIHEESNSEPVLPGNIPQFSNFEDAYLETPKVLGLCGRELTFCELGIYLDNGKTKNEVAQRKYGENHSKLATLLDLAIISADNNTYRIALSVFGAVYNQRTKYEKEMLVARLLFRIPIIQSMFSKALKNEINVDTELLCLSMQTRKRRKPNVIAIMHFIFNKLSGDDRKLNTVFKNIKGWR